MKRKSSTIIPNVVRGGVAISLGNNYFYMKGRKHTNGGIDIGNNPRTGLEVEGEEIVHTSPKELKVYSSVPFLNGKSPAEKVLGGENPNKVFNEQQQYKRVNKLNDDGSKKAMGGLNRNKDFGSDKRLYPNVNKNDFAGKDRSYPIPTKADAVDALRLAGLHGRNDVRTKVLNRYPELRQKAKRGGIYTVNIGGVEHLKSTSFTGEETKRNIAELGTEKRDKTRVNNWYIDRVNEMNEKSNSNITDSIPPFNFYNTYKNIIGNPSYNTIDTPRDNTAIKRVVKDNTSPSTTKETNIGARYTINEDNGKNATINEKRFVRGTDYMKDYNFIGPRLPKDFTRRVVEDNNTAIGPGIIGPRLPKDFVRRDSNVESNENINNTNINTITNNSIEQPRVSNSINTPSNNVPKPNTNINNSNLNSNSTIIKPSINNKPINTNVSKNNAKISVGNTKTSTNNNKSTNVDRQRNKDYFDLSRFTRQLPTDIARIQNPNNTLATKKESTDSNSTNSSNSKFNQLVANNDITLGDAIGTLSNIAGNLISYGANKRMLNKLKSPNQPIARQATKLKTKININPQLDNIRELVSSSEKDIEGNTASSRAALARKQRVRNIGQQQSNQLYGSKENAETQLINQDRLNQQEVTNKNIEDYNRYRDTVTAFKNAVTEKKSENAIDLISGMNNSMQDLISRREKRNADRQTRLAILAAHPNVNPRILKTLGIKGISDKDIANWDKAFGKK